jgi:hypothetical protein
VLRITSIRTHPPTFTLEASQIPGQGRSPLAERDPCLRSSKRSKEKDGSPRWSDSSRSNRDALDEILIDLDPDEVVR